MILIIVMIVIITNPMIVMIVMIVIIAIPMIVMIVMPIMLRTCREFRNQDFRLHRVPGGG